MKTKGFMCFDDSKHNSSGFYLGAFVYSETDLNDEICKIISDCGLDPDKYEFKSCVRMDGNPEYQKVRYSLRDYVLSKRIAVVISPPNEIEFQEITSDSVVQVIENNKERIKHPLKIFLDEGIIKNKSNEKYKLLMEYSEVNGIKLNIEQDSKKIKGIQLADFVAHSCSIMLKEELGLINKKTKAGIEMGYDTDIEIGFEYWAYLRHCFFGKHIPSNPKYDEIPFQVMVENYGLFISPKCNDTLKSAAIKRFGKMYLGCTH